MLNVYPSSQEQLKNYKARLTFGGHSAGTLSTHLEMSCVGDGNV
jgi:hypothetical protein